MVRSVILYLSSRCTTGMRDRKVKRSPAPPGRDSRKTKSQATSQVLLRRMRTGPWREEEGLRRECHARVHSREMLRILPGARGVSIFQRVQAQAVWSDQGQHVRVGDDGQAGRRPAEWQGPDHKRPRRPREHTDNAASSQWTNRPLEDLQHQNGHENTFLIKRLRILIWY